MMGKLRSRDGYALAYVVVVITLVLAIAGGSALASTRNLNSQLAAVDQLQAKAEADGEVERVYAGIMNCSGTLEEYSNYFTSNDITVDIEEPPYTVNVKVTTANCVIEATFNVVLEELTTTGDGESDPPESEKTYRTKSVTYTSYSVTYTSSEEENET